MVHLLWPSPVCIVPVLGVAAASVAMHSPSHGKWLDALFGLALVWGAVCQKLSKPSSSIFELTGVEDGYSDFPTSISPPLYEEQSGVGSVTFAFWLLPGQEGVAILPPYVWGLLCWLVVVIGILQCDWQGDCKCIVLTFLSLTARMNPNPNLALS